MAICNENTKAIAYKFAGALDEYNETILVVLIFNTMHSQLKRKRKNNYPKTALEEFLLCCNGLRIWRSLAQELPYNTMGMAEKEKINK